MRFQHGTDIVSKDNKTVGHLDRVVLDPETLEVTHLIVHKGLLLTHDRVIPISRVAEADDKDEKLRLVVNADQVETMPELDETVYVPIEEAEKGRVKDVYPNVAAMPTFYWYPAQYGVGAAGLGPAPVPVVPPDYVAETKRNIPQDTVALKIGAKVLDSQGQHVGDVEELLMDEGSEQVTSFVLSQGTFFKERKRVPVLWVDVVTDDEVHLNSRSERLRTLPTVEAAHH